MNHFYEKFENKNALFAIRFQEQKIYCPEKRYAGQVRTLFREDYVKRGIAQAEKLAQELEFVTG